MTVIRVAQTIVGVIYFVLAQSNRAITAVMAVKLQSFSLTHGLHSASASQSVFLPVGKAVLLTLKRYSAIDSVAFFSGIGHPKRD
jgi:hypothetical protein